MYRIKYYNNDIYVPGDDVYSILEPVLVREENKAGSLSFTILQDHPLCGSLDKLRLGVEVQEDGETIFKGRIVDSRQNFDNEYDITIEGQLAVLNDSMCRPYEFTGTPEELFTWFINNHNSQVSEEQQLLKGNVTVTDPNNYINRSWEDTEKTWTLMESRLLETLGGYFIIRYEDDGDYIDWLEGFSLYANQDVELGENLLDLSIFVDASETYTACIPYGAKLTVSEYEEVDLESATWEEDEYYLLGDDESYTLIATEAEFNNAITNGIPVYELKATQTLDERLTVESVNDGYDYIINDDKAGEYGIIYAPTNLVTWDDVTRPESLLSKATDWLNNDGVTLKRTVEVSTLDLARLGFDVGKIKMYHNLRVVSAPHNVDVSYLVRKMEINLDNPEESEIALGSSEPTFTDKTVGIIEKIDKIEVDYATNEEVTDEIIYNIAVSTSQILQTSEEIVLGILAGYTTTEALDNYKAEIENLFRVSEEGFSFEFSQLEEQITALGNEIVEQEQYIKLIEGEIHIGKSDNPITTVYTNDALEFRYNNQVVARFTNEVLEVRNISVDNQVAFFDQWAIRQGAYIDGVGYNLNDVWIGG